ncbi:MAG TPA: J domain-containing protein [Polyangia bacterium]
MSIGKRLIDLARSELNSLLEKAAHVDGDDDDDQSRPRYGSEYGSMSDKELAEEIERRRQAREEVEQATSHTRRPEPRTPPPRRTAAGDDAIRKAYAALEVPAGSDLETDKRSYRRLMRKYHPDLNAGSKEKQRAATDLSQRLTEAYKTLERHLRR